LSFSPQTFARLFSVLAVGDERRLKPRVNCIVDDQPQPINPQVSAEQILRFDLESFRDDEEMKDAEVSDSALDAAHVTAVDSREVREHVLADLPRFAQLSDPLADGLEMWI